MNLENKIQKKQNKHWFCKLEGYLLIPHELLHIVGFWLVGKQCKYQWGKPYITPIGNMSKKARLVGRLFPFIIFFFLLIIFTILAGLASKQIAQTGNYTPFLIWGGLIYITAIYIGTTIGDLRRAYLLIINKPWYAKTPLDLFYWPLIDWDDVREKIAKGEILTFNKHI